MARKQIGHFFKPVDSSRFAFADRGSAGSEIAVRESGARRRKTVNVEHEQRRPLSLKSIDSFASYRFAAFRVTRLLADSDRM